MSASRNTFIPQILTFISTNPHHQVLPALLHLLIPFYKLKLHLLLLPPLLSLLPITALASRPPKPMEIWKLFKTIRNLNQMSWPILIVLLASLLHLGQMTQISHQLLLILISIPVLPPNHQSAPTVTTTRV